MKNRILQHNWLAYFSYLPSVRLFWGWWWKFPTFKWIGSSRVDLRLINFIISSSEEFFDSLLLLYSVLCRQVVVTEEDSSSWCSLDEVLWHGISWLFLRIWLITLSNFASCCLHSIARSPANIGLSNSNLVAKCCDGDFLMAVCLTLALKFSLGFEPLSSDVSLGGKSKLYWELVEAVSSSLTGAFWSASFQLPQLSVWDENNDKNHRIEQQ